MPTSRPSRPEAGAPEVGAAELRRAASLIEAEAGLHFGPTKHPLLAARLGKRMRALGLSSAKDYLRQAGEGDELRRLLDQVTTNQTAFWREPQHFLHLAAWLSEDRRPGPRRVWCAACSSGEEAYTLAMAGLQALDGSAGLKVLASDLSERMLDKAMEGVYEGERLQALPAGWRERWFRPLSGGRWSAGPELRACVSFARLNLTSLPPAPLGLDAVFCRNVMIYFDRPVQSAVVAQLEARLRPGGYLYTGMAESLLAIRHNLLNRAPSVYQRPL